MTKPANLPRLTARVDQIWIFGREKQAGRQPGTVSAARWMSATTDDRPRIAL
jgi:hypothetical protein